MLQSLKPTTRWPINTAIGPGLGVTGTGIPANTTVLTANVVSGVWTVTLSNNATASGAQSLTFDNNISVSGGVVMLYPYLFVYGNNGLIQNCSAGNFNNWKIQNMYEEGAGYFKRKVMVPVCEGCQYKLIVNNNVFTTKEYLDWYGKNQVEFSPKRLNSYN